MSKRPASTGISCPGCSTNFDTETHIPFVGTCGDSICAVCLNEKKIKNCPECNLEGAFAWNQRNTLAMKFLSATAENEASDSKKTKLDVGEDTDAPGEPVPAILDPNNRHFLAQIVSQLDPRSFVRLARTCKILHNYCFNSKDVKIIYDLRLIEFKRCRGSFLEFRMAATKYDDKPNEWCEPMDYAGYKQGFLRSADARRRLKKYPFSFRLEELRIQASAGFEFFEPLRLLVAQFPIQKITKVDAWWVDDWNGFMKLIKDFHIKDVKIRNRYFPEDAEELFFEMVQNLTKFESYFPFSERAVLNFWIPTLRIYSTEISKNTFTQLVMKCANSTDDLDWALKQCSFDLDIDGLFEEVLPYYHKGPISGKRPLAFHKKYKSSKFYILREDGKVVCCSNFIDYLYISMVDPKDYPPCILPESDEPWPEVDSDDYSENESVPFGNSDEEPESDGDSDGEPESDNRFW